MAEIPFFIKAGTVLPLREVMQYTQQRNPEVLELNVYYSDTSSKSSLYQDGEEGYDYSTGHYLTTEFELQVTPDKNTATLTANYKGAYTPSHHTVKINFIGFPFTPSSISVDGGKVPIDTTGNRSVFSIDTEPLFEEILLS